MPFPSILQPLLLPQKKNTELNSQAVLPQNSKFPTNIIAVISGRVPPHEAPHADGEVCKIDSLQQVQSHFRPQLLETRFPVCAVLFQQPLK